ncbi:MAG: SUMF1/EgtB/PvdO family nonheme iron enzyme [Nitrospira sp.]|nr:SUMF1/EgtB/PvdO family nonheme iron enzyme [Nitrospira sp.]
MAKAFLDSYGVGYETAASAKKLEPAEIGAAAKQFTLPLECYSEKLGAEHRALEAERRALESERRALDEERRALAEARRTDQEARQRALRLEQEERARKEQVAAEQLRLQRQKELAEAQAASGREAGANAQAQLEAERIETERLARETAEQEQRGRDKLLPEQTRQGKPIVADRINGNDGAPMILVPEGEFLFGKNHHKIVLPAFYIDAYEVSTQLYASFMQATGHNKPEHWGDVRLELDGNKPVIGVEWSDADAYCRYYGKRLPNEQEWEKAARGTDGRTYPWGNTPPTKALSNYGDAICLIFCNVYAEKLKPVNYYEGGRSPYGIYNMAGNAWEWVEGKRLRGGNWLLPDPRLDELDGASGEITRTYGRRYTLGFRCAQDAR